MEIAEAILYGHYAPMQLNPSVRRNDPCPCGSGRKFKFCCQDKTVAAPSSPTRWVVPLIIALVVVFAIARTVFDGSKGTQDKPVQTSTDGVLPLPRTANGQPPGPAPAGKVWSAEHGHWHDAPAGGQAVSITPTPTGTSGGPVPQPPGAVPEGKVWSPEHGHWHDAPGTAPAPQNVQVTPSPSTPTPQPPGPAPEGKVWSPEHGHWHDAPAAVSTATAAPGTPPFETMPTLVAPAETSPSAVNPNPVEAK